MVKRVKVIVAIVAIVMVVSTLFVYADMSRPRPSEAERTIIGASDLGPNWTGGWGYIGHPPQYQLPGLDSFVDYWFHNGTDTFWVSVRVYNSTAECQAAYQKLNDNFYEFREWNNYSTVQIADAGFLGWERPNSTYRYPFIGFMEGSVLCHVQADDMGQYSQQTVDTALFVAHQQEAKIKLRQSTDG